MWRNTRGNCDAQLKCRVLDLQKRIGRAVGSKDNHALTSAIRRRFGSFNNGMRYFDLQTRPKGRKI